MGNSSQRPSITLTGIGASSGIALGPAFLVDRRRLRTPRYHIDPDDMERELLRLEEALERSDEQLLAIKETMEELEGAEHSMILEAHRLMLQDPGFTADAYRIIKKQCVNAEWAVRRAARKIRNAFDQVDDDYFRERKHDVDFVADRLIRNLLGQKVDPEPSHVPRGSIIVSRDLSPSDAAMLLRPERVVGLVTDRGTKTSHTSIIAHSRGIPAVVGVEKISELALQGDEVAIDGDKGLLVVRPTPQQVVKFHVVRQRQIEAERDFAAESLLPAITADGHEVPLRANIEFEEEVPAVHKAGAVGIGLYRTEYLFLGRRSSPTEEEHYRAYRQVIEAMEGEPVTIRTVDVGGDKMPAMEKSWEPNPALGLRAVRYCLKHPEVFHAQLRALLRASIHGRLKILFPMISGVVEFRQARAALERAREELLSEGVPVADGIEVGAMIEMPSAALTADRLAREVDFFSIGTNDLIQYSLAIDRQNRKVAYLYRPLHLAMLRMLQFIVEAAHAHGKRVTLCGEMAGEPHYALVLLGLGVDELSMAPGSIPLLRRMVRASTLQQARELVGEILELDTADDIEEHVRRRMVEQHPEIFGAVDELEEPLAP